MLHGRKFALLTDHKPLRAIFGSRKGIPIYTANRLQSIQHRSTTSIGEIKEATTNDRLLQLIKTYTKAKVHQQS
ncbi:hypothetical protein ANCDUO_18175 [Ancylostoma duodenale]|uniref:Reverse transcriptase RNase H-like domain-containing protein n=1 Tax=Ancylostoma duodenale TaxID=51022 RepID=A0A0C2CPM6_9BILA|nr:hypothetical protein ANCDUO_18175 [Ancylostoma duodenale]